jgi:four helix bundle protein
MSAGRGYLSRMQNYHNLLVWRKAHALALNVYRLMNGVRERRHSALVSQIRRAALSIPTNIVEGSARESDREFASFLQTSFASSSELQYHLEFARDADVIAVRDEESRRKELVEVRQMLTGLIRTIRATDAGSRKPKTRTGRRPSAESIPTKGSSSR